MKWILIFIFLFITGGAVNMGQNLLAYDRGEKSVEDTAISIASGYVLSLHNWSSTAQDAWEDFKQNGGTYPLAVVGLSIAVYLFALTFLYKIVYTFRDFFRLKPEISKSRAKFFALVIAIMLLLVLTIGMNYLLAFVRLVVSVVRSWGVV